MLILEKAEDKQLRLRVLDETVLNLIGQNTELEHFWATPAEDGWLIDAGDRGNVKQALIKAGYPVKDVCGYVEGTHLDIALRDVDTDGNAFALRDYQRDAVDTFYQGGRSTGAAVSLYSPAGPEKPSSASGPPPEFQAIPSSSPPQRLRASMARRAVIQNKPDVRIHWRIHRQLKMIKPVTITTYQMLTHRRNKLEPMKNLEIFTHNNWGLIIYDEVHMLPAPVFRATTTIQAKRRLGLTATLVREDGKEDDVFALIGPKRYDVPWKTLENRGSSPKPFAPNTGYHSSKGRNPLCRRPQTTAIPHRGRKSLEIELAGDLIANHPDDNILIIGQYISQLEEISKTLGYPLITGKTKHDQREKLYAEFKAGRIRILVVSKVANFAIDLPDANVMIQISGSFGSRQEEAQRLGRILRPNNRLSSFYTLVSKGTDEQAFSLNRQLFLVEQGYRYHIRYFGGA